MCHTLSYKLDECIMILLLLGLMGSGRTSIGSCIASNLGYDFIEIQDEVLKRTGFTSYEEAYKGKLTKWKEAELVLSCELSDQDNIVVSASNTYIDNDLNLHYFKESGKEFHVVYLRTNPEVITKRLTSLHENFKKEGSSRIMKRVQEFYNLRDSLFTHYADFIVDTDDKIPEEACKIIRDKVAK